MKGDSRVDVGDLYEEYEARLHGYAVALGRDPDVADDLVQETLIRASANLGLLERLHPAQRQAWLSRTLKHLFLDQRRSRARYGVLIEQLARTVEADMPMPLGWTALDLLDSVPDPDHELLELRYVQGMTSREIGEELGIPAATARSRLRLALGRLRARQSDFL